MNCGGPIQLRSGSAPLRLSRPLHGEGACVRPLMVAYWKIVQLPASTCWGGEDCETVLLMKLSFFFAARFEPCFNNCCFEICKAHASLWYILVMVLVENLPKIQVIGFESRIGHFRKGDVSSK